MCYPEPEPNLTFNMCKFENKKKRRAKAEKKQQKLCVELCENFG